MVGQKPQNTISRRLKWSCHFQICHQRLVLRKLGLIAYNNKSIPTTSKITLKTLMLCVFIIMASGPNCNHISQPPTIANIALTIKLIEIIYSFLNLLYIG